MGAGRLGRRRSYDWAQIAAMARSADGVWRSHSDLRAVTFDTLRHMQRRVLALQPTTTGRYEFARGNEAVDEYGRTIFDLYIRFIKQGEHRD